MNKKIVAMNFSKPESKKFWTLTYKDHDARTCNPGLLVSDWSVVQEIEKITTELHKERRNVFICTSKTYEKLEEVPSFEAELKCFETIGFKYDPWLIW